MREVDDEFVVLLRVHATRENLSELGGFIQQLAACFADDSRFRLSLRPVRRLGGPNDAALAVLDPEEEPRLEVLKSEAKKKGLTLHSGAFDSPGSLQGCYAAAANSLVVRSNGDLAKCTVAFHHPRNRVGVLLPDGGVRLDTEKMLGWLRGVFNEDDASLTCPMKGWADIDSSDASALGREPLINITASRDERWR